jgi:hypothetical protein
MPAANETFHVLRHRTATRSIFNSLRNRSVSEAARPAINRQPVTAGNDGNDFDGRSGFSV